MRCAFCEEPAWYRCARSGLPICPRHARVEVVAARDEVTVGSCTLRASEPHDRERLEQLALHFWGETEVECFDRVYDVLKLPAIVAELGGALVGFVSYAVDGAVDGERMNLVMFNVLPDFQGRGVGKELLQAAVEKARLLGLTRLAVATSNDDLPALGFYQRAGFTVEAVVPGRILQHHGKEERGFAGVPVRDEIWLQLPPA
jgi:ribosomal protein S18 acetylase RimI-like enzyme